MRTCLPAWSTSARTIALSAPRLTSASRAATLNERIVARSPTASKSEVFPAPLGPFMTVTPAAGTNSACSKHLKSVIHKCFSDIWLTSLPDAGTGQVAEQLIGAEPEHPMSGNPHRHEQVPVVIVVRPTYRCRLSRVKCFENDLVSEDRLDTFYEVRRVERDRVLLAFVVRVDVLARVTDLLGNDCQLDSARTAWTIEPEWCCRARGASPFARRRAVTPCRHGS